jgi:acetyltransferase-like isoleucine patch superfamily enzyme
MSPQHSLKDIEGRVRHHPGWQGKYLGNTAGYTEPSFGDLDVIEVTDASLPMLRTRGIAVSGPASETFICNPPGVRYSDLKVALNGRRRGLIIIGNAPKLGGALTLAGDNNLFVFSDTAGTCRVSATFRGNDGSLFVGRSSSANSVEFLIQGPGRSIQIGDDAMISYQVQVRTSDSHGIVSLRDPTKAINPPASISIGPHVWLGAHSTVQKGRRIGAGAIVGGHSIVTRDVPACTLVVGSPAEIKQVEVTWTRESQPNPVQIAEAIAATKAGT